MNASFGKESLNTFLWKGESCDLNLLTHLLRLLFNKYIIMADIQKAFLQVPIHPEDKKYLRFVWKHDKIIRQVGYKTF